MTYRLGYTIVFTVLGVSSLLAACSDDPSIIDEGNGGAGGEPSSTAGSKSAGSSAGGSASKAGSGSSGDAGSGEAGAPSQGGEPAAGGAPTGAAGSDGSAGDDGAAGAGGAGALEYACNSTTIAHKVCSALEAANCETATICPDCVGEKAADIEAFGGCPACGEQYDAFLQCGIDAYESGNLSSGIECYDGFADLNDACAVHLNETLACQNYVLENDCPATWPVE